MVLQPQPGDVLSCRDTVLLAPCSGCGAGGAGGQQPGVLCLGRRGGVVPELQRAYASTHAAWHSSFPRRQPLSPSCDPSFPH